MYLRVTFAATLYLLCSACSDPGSPSDMYDNYLTRVANVLEMEVPVAESVPPLPAYPAAREIRLQSDDIRVGLVDFLSFSECQMLHQISERNSGLGRVQQSTVRLRYEVQFYYSLKSCLDRMRQQTQIDEEDAKWLSLAQDVLERKAKLLPQAYWNATFASPEFRVLLSTGSRAMQRDESPPLTTLNTDLGFLVSLNESLYSGGPEISDQQYEQHYYRLQQQKTIGQWLQGLFLSRIQMDRATQLLQQAHHRNRLCPAGKKTVRAGYLQNVFMKFYAGEVQPYLSTLHRAGQVIHPRLEALLEAQSVQLPEAFTKHYRLLLDPATPNGLWQQFNRSLSAHTKAWQALLSQCGMMPGQARQAG